MTSHQKRRPNGAALFNLGGSNSADLNGEGCNSQSNFTTHRQAALALLNCGMDLTRKAGSFLGQCVADPVPLTERQVDWLAKLLERAELPPLESGGQ